MNKYTRLPFYQYFSDQSLGKYGGKPRFTVDYKNIKYKHIGHKHDVAYCVMFDEDRDVYQIYFKETYKWNQWLCNFDFPKKYYDSFQYEGKDIQLKASRGWVSLYCAIKWYIRNELKALATVYGMKEVEIIGWSLGSALAQLCAQDLFFNFGIQSHLFTFGSVKCWCSKDANVIDYLKNCTKECFNFYSWNDIVGYMVCLPHYFAMNHIKLKTDKHSIFRWFNPMKWHTEYWKEDWYKDFNLPKEDKK